MGAREIECEHRRPWLWLLAGLSVSAVLIVAGIGVYQPRARKLYRRVTKRPLQAGDTYRGAAAIHSLHEGASIAIERRE
jgi:hypothetical protein